MGGCMLDTSSESQGKRHGQAPHAERPAGRPRALRQGRDGGRATGPIAVGAINGSVSNRMPGHNAETTYGITWTATKSL